MTPKRTRSELASQPVSAVALASPGVKRWQFRARFRRHAFGWKSQPAITRVAEAVDEIRRAARRDPIFAAEGAVLFLERISPALEHVDSSSGAIGSAVNRAIDTLVPIISDAPADAATRVAWLERLYEAHQADEIPYIEALADRWGELCVSSEVASVWADRLIGITRMALSRDKQLRGYFHGTTMCLSALHRAGRFDEVIELVHPETIWPYRRFVVAALAARGERVAALRYAESCRSPWASDAQIDATCEELLLAEGRAEEAYTRYARRANRRTTYLATFRAIVEKYPHKAPHDVLRDLVADSPGNEGKWFAAAKDAGLFELALQLAASPSCDPKTLARTARNLAVKAPAFAVRLGELAVQGMLLGRGFDVTGLDMLEAYRATMAAAEAQGCTLEVKKRLRSELERLGALAGPLANTLRGALTG